MLIKQLLIVRDFIAIIRPVYQFVNLGNKFNNKSLIIFEMYSQRFDNNQFNEEFRGIPPASNPINTIQLVLEFHRKRIVRYLGVSIIKKNFYPNIFEYFQSLAGG